MGVKDYYKRIYFIKDLFNFRRIFIGKRTKNN